MTSPLDRAGRSNPDIDSNFNASNAASAAAFASAESSAFSAMNAFASTNRQVPLLVLATERVGRVDRKLEERFGIGFGVEGCGRAAKEPQQRVSVLDSVHGSLIYDKLA